MLKRVVGVALVGLSAAAWIVVIKMNLPKGQAKMYFFLSAVPIVVVWLCAESILKRRRTARVRARLVELGFEDSTNTALHYAPESKHHSFELRYSMAADWRALAVQVAEYEYTIGMGKSSQTHEFFEARIPLDRDWPSFRLEHAKGFMRRPMLQLFTPPTLAAEFGNFGKTTEIIADEPETVARVFGPELRQWLAERPKKETWCLKDGVLSCTWRGACEVRDVESVLGRLAMFLAKAPT